MKENFFILLFFVICAIIADSCTSQKESLTEKMSDKKSAVDTNHATAVSDKSDQLSDTASSIVSGSVYLIEENGKWGWLNHLGQVVVAPKYDSIGQFGYAGAPFRMGGFWGVIDRNGKIIHEAALDYPAAEAKTGPVGVITIDAVPSVDTVFYGPVGIVKKQKSALPGHTDYTLIDINGRRISDNTFSYVSAFHDGMAVAGIGADTVLSSVKKTGKKQTVKRSRYGFINAKTQFVVEPVYDEIGPWPSDVPILVRIGGLKIPGGEYQRESCKGCRYGYIDNTGKIIIPAVYDRAKPFVYGVAWVKTGCVSGDCADGKDGLIDTAGKYLLAPDYSLSFISGFYNGAAIVCAGGRTVDNEHIGGKWGLVSVRGEWLVKPIYDNMKYMSDTYQRHIRVNKGCQAEDGYYCKGGKWGVLNVSGKETVPCVYDAIETFENGYACVQSRNKYGLIDTGGTIIHVPVFDYLIPFHDLAIVNRGGMRNESGEITGGQWSVIDRNGKEILTGMFHRIEPFGAVAVIRQDSVCGVIDNKGVLIIKPVYEEITVFDSVLRMKKSGKYGLFAIDGALLQKTDFDLIDDCISYGLAKFRKGKIWGYFNPKGEMVWKSKE